MSAERLPPGLRSLLDELALEELPDLLREARAQAREQVRELLAAALADALVAQLEAGSGKAAAAAPEASDEAGELGLYVYGVIAAGETLPDGLAGIAPAHPPRLLASGAVAAVLSEVPLAQFGEEPLRRHLEDLAWVERTARAHESLLEALGARLTLIPMRMCTIYRSERRVLEMLEREGAALGEALTALAGKSEWGVKLFATAASAQATGDGTRSAGLAVDEPVRRRFPTDAERSAGLAVGAPEKRPSSGTDYMRCRRAERERRERHEQQLEQACAAIHLRLSAAAYDSRALSPLPSQAGGHRAAMLANGVYLVENDRLEGFLSEVESARKEAAGQGLELQRTGPWPAYNFVPGTIGATW